VRRAQADVSTVAFAVEPSRLVIVDQGGGPYRVLYLCGRPDWEFKFLRRALRSDDQVQLVGLIRIARRQPKFDFRNPRDSATSQLFKGFEHPDPETAERSDQPVLIRLGTLDEVEPILPNSRLSNGTLYTLHATTATVLDGVGASPVQVVIQWTKASSHAQTPAQVDQAVEAIASVYRRANDQAAVVRAICAIYAHGSPTIHLVVERAGVYCPP